MLDNYRRDITYLRLSVTDLCNFRCRYCMPAKGVTKKHHGDILNEDEMIEAVEAAASIGIRKLRITGGEPLVKKNIISLCERASAVPGIDEVCMTTNASLLPQFASDLRKAGVKRLNISLDTLDPKKFAYMSRIGKLEDTLAGIECALNAGFDKIKLNTVLIGGFNDDEIPALCELTRRWPVDMRFIEWMPMFSASGFDRNAVLSVQSVLNALSQIEPVGIDGVARTYRLPGAQGNIGLISPLSSHFCDRCSRIRLTADGMLKPCLHSPQEYSIRGLHGEALRERFREAILAKPARHERLSVSETSQAGRTMAEIGG